MDREPKRTKTEMRALARMVEDLERQRDEVREWARTNNVVPRGWKGLDRRVPVEPHKQKVTLRLDADMLAWFRKMGRGHQTRMNAVLRAYMNGVIARALAHQGDKDLGGRPL